MRAALRQAKPRGRAAGKFVVHLMCWNYLIDLDYLGATLGDLVKPCLHPKLASDHAATITAFWGDLVATLGDLVKPCLHPKLASDHAATMKGFGGDLGVTLGFPGEGRASSS